MWRISETGHYSGPRKNTHGLRCVQSPRSNVVQIGVLEWWSNGVTHLKPNAPILPYSNNPFFMVLMLLRFTAWLVMFAAQRTRL